MSLDPFLPCLPRHAAVACDAFGPVHGAARAPARFQASAGSEVLGPGSDEPVLPADSEEVGARERRRGYVRCYVAVGAEAVALALLVVVVGRQLAPALGTAASGGGAASWVHDLLAETRELLARMSGAELRSWLPSALAALLTILGPWLRSPAARWGLAAAVGSRTTSVISWLVIVVALAGPWWWA